MDKKIKIVLIEDNPGDVRQIKEMLKEVDASRFELKYFDRLSTGLAGIVEGTADAVLLDLGLPDSQGLDALKKVHVEAREKPIVVLTGLFDEMIGFKAVQEGAQDYLVKGHVDGNLLVRSILYAIERKRAKEALEMALKNWQKTFSAIADGVFILDTEGRVIMSNGVFESMAGIKTENVIGQRCYETVHGTSDFIEDCPFKRMKQTGMRESFEFEDKERGLWFQGTVDPVCNESGEIINAVYIMRNVTELKKAEETRLENLRLEAADKAKNEFLANMSHELRTPLNASIGFSELLTQGMAGELSEKQKHFMDNILTSNQFLLTLINDILDLSKIETGKIELVPGKMSVPVTIKETLTLIKEKAMKDNVLLETEFDAELEFIGADKQRFKQILFNLLSNAVKFSKEEGGTVTIRTKKEGDTAKISISDTGIGIKEENIGKLFRKFEQLESEIGKKYGGTGLGLSITKQLVELHGGKIWAESKYGEGSTFTFTLPIVAKKGEESK